MDAIEDILGEPIDSTLFKKLLKYCQLRITEEYKVPPEIMSINGIPIATLGNFSASVGKPKSTKTFNVSAFVAAALTNCRVLCYQGNLPKDKCTILYIDTEQSKYHCHKVMARILKLAGLPLDREPKNLKFLMLREYNPEDRRKIIAGAITENKGIGLVVIDGLRDLMHDINSSGESIDIICDLMKWTSCFNLHVHTVLHLNKGDDNTRGHIGTELNNKAETVLQITKNSIDNYSEVKAMHIRDREFEPFAYRINSDALPELVLNYKEKTSQRLTVSTISEEIHRNALEEVFADGDIEKYSNLIISMQLAYAKYRFTRGKNSINNLLKFLLMHNIIIKESTGYHYNSDFNSSNLEV